jgi:hypothetical protein
MVKPCTLVVVAAIVGVSACGGTPTGPPPLPPIPLSITKVEPSTGWSSGGSVVTISGTGFRSPTLTIGGARVGYTGVSDQLFATLPAHAPGIADVVLTNYDGESVTSLGAITYLTIEGVDLNGLWEGGAVPDFYSVPLQLTVDHDHVISFSCGSSGVIVLDPAPPINNGRFLYAGAKGVSIDGVFSTPAEVDGAINAPSCEQTYWYARKK